MIHLDTSVLMAGLSGPRAFWIRLRSVLDNDEELRLSTPVLYEWLRGSRNAAEIELQQALFPDANAVLFGPIEAALSASFYRSLPRARPRVMDFAIAACAVSQQAELWTLNPDDFADIPGLHLYRATRGPRRS